MWLSDKTQKSRCGFNSPSLDFVFCFSNFSNQNYDKTCPQTWITQQQFECVIILHKQFWRFQLWVTSTNLFFFRFENFINKSTFLSDFEHFVKKKSGRDEKIKVFCVESVHSVECKRMESFANVSTIFWPWWDSNPGPLCWFDC